MTTLKFGDIKLDTTANCAKPISELELSTDADTEDKNAKKDGYIKYNNAKAAEVTLTVILDAGFGCDVRKETLVLITEARTGSLHTLYLDGEKLTPWKMILTEAEATEIQIGLGGEWVHAEVELTFRQGGKTDKDAEIGKNSETATEALKRYQEMMMAVRAAKEG